MPLGAAMIGCGDKKETPAAPLPGAPTASNAAKPGASAGKDLKSSFEITAANQASLMPFTEGSTWTFDVEIEQQRAGAPPVRSPGEVTYKIDAAKKRGDETQFLLGIYEKGKKKDEQMWSSGPKGIYQLSLGPQRREFDPPQPVIKFPVKVGETFDWSGTSQNSNGRRISSKLQGAAAGAQTVDTAMGPAQAMLIETQNTFDVTAPDGRKIPAVSRTDSWFRPGVGIVRYRQTTRTQTAAVVTTLRLKSYKIN